MRVAIIGGGLSGLTIAYRRAQAGDRVTLHEAGKRLGGQLWSERVAGFVVEHGAEGFVARSEAVERLAIDLGIADRLVEQLVHRSFRFDGQALLELAPGEAARLLGFQVASDELGRGIRSFLGGMSDLPDALEHALTGRAELRVRSAVQRVDPLANGVRLTCDGGAPEDYDAAVVATGAVRAGALLAHAFGAPASALSASATSSSVTVTLAYPRTATAHPLDGTGFISDPALLAGARAATFVSSKLPGRAPPGHALFRLFFRPSNSELQEASEAWTARAHQALQIALSVSEPPERSWVSHWAHALPLIDDPHRERVKTLEQALAGSSVTLSGSAFHGSGIDAAVRSAERVAAALGP